MSIESISSIISTVFTGTEQVLPIVFEKIEERNANKETLMGLASGFYDLDNYLSGFQKSQLVLLCGSTSMGKTSLASNIATNIAFKEKKPVLFFSLEMSKEQLVQRILCTEAEVDAQRIRMGELNGADFEKIASAMGRLGDAPLFIHNEPYLTLEKIYTIISDFKVNFPDCIVFIDYVQLIDLWRDTRYNEASHISRELKLMARHFEIPIIGLSQLSRALESRPDKRPRLSDIRDSGTYEEDADVVMFIYRDEYYNPDTDRPGIADIIIAKQRNGPVGNIQLIFRNNITRFINPLDTKITVF